MSTVKILLLRGVNVGGANRLPMPEFRQLLAELGVQGAQTHIQTGNVVFADPGIADLPGMIAAGMSDRFGFAPKMFIMSLAAYDAILMANPYAAQENGPLVHIFFLDAPFAAKDVAALTELAGRDESVTFAKNAVYLHAPSGVGRSKLAEKIGASPRVGVTARNLTSANAISALARTIG